MNKRYAVILAASALCALSSSSMTHARGNKQLVQSHMNDLDTTLATLERSGRGLTYEERMRILGNLRRKFAHRKMRPYKTKNEEEVVRLIGRSYEEIKNTPGDHTKALKHYKEEATGRIALYTKPTKLKKAPARSTASQPTKPSMVTRASEALGTLTGSPAGVGGQVTPHTAPARSVPHVKDVTPLKKSTTKAQQAGKKKTFEERMKKKKNKKAKKKAKKKEEPKKLSKPKKATVTKAKSLEKKPRKVAK